jgi:hypothetical protein
VPLDESLYGPCILPACDPRVPYGAAGIEVARENGSAYDQSRQVNIVDSISAAFDSGLIVHIYQSRASDLSPVYCFPYVEVLYVRTFR